MSNLYFQCRLKKVGTTTYTVAWIEERGAVVDRKVDLIKPNEGWWNVEEVHKPGVEYEVLKEKQEKNRNAFPSILGAS